MDDSISRRDAIKTSLEFFVEFLGGAFHENEQKELIARFQRLPSADRPSGEWVQDTYGWVYCSHCKKYLDDYQMVFFLKPFDYCPNCGADMRGEQDD